MKAILINVCAWCRRLTGVIVLSSSQINGEVGHGLPRTSQRLSRFSVDKGRVAILHDNDPKVQDETYPSQSLPRPHLLMSTIGADKLGSDSLAVIFITALELFLHASVSEFISL